MADKIMLIEIGYYSFVCPMDIGKNVLEAFLAMVPVNKEYINNVIIYQPDKKQEVSVKYIPSENVRIATTEEKEKKEIVDLKQRLEWKDGDLKREQESKKAIECELKLLKKEMEEANVTTTKETVNR